MRAIVLAVSHHPLSANVMAASGRVEVFCRRSAEQSPLVCAES